MAITSKRYIHATDLMEQQSIELMNKMYEYDSQLRLVKKKAKKHRRLPVLL